MLCLSCLISHPPVLEKKDQFLLLLSPVFFSLPFSLAPSVPVSGLLDAVLTIQRWCRTRFKVLKNRRFHLYVLRRQLALHWLDDLIDETLRTVSMLDKGQVVVRVRGSVAMKGYYDWDLGWLCL